MNRVIRQGVKTKVLMLSATPVNNRFNDLKNQLQLAYEGKVENINEELDMDHSIDDVFRNAQTVYNRWAKLDVKERTTERLLNELSFDFFQLLDASCSATPVLPTMPRKSISTKSSSSYWIGRTMRLSRISK